MAKGELSEDFIDAGWPEWDLDDAYLIIEDALDYLAEHDSL